MSGRLAVGAGPGQHHLGGTEGSGPGVLAGKAVLPGDR